VVEEVDGLRAAVFPQQEHIDGRLVVFGGLHEDAVKFLSMLWGIMGQAHVSHDGLLWFWIIWRLSFSIALGVGRQVAMRLPLWVEKFDFRVRLAWFIGWWRERLYLNAGRLVSDGFADASGWKVFL
jgi:hypothetical protein